MKERFGIHSIFVKQLICFALGNAIIVLVMTAIFLNAFQLAREEVYDRMNALPGDSGCSAGKYL